MKKLLIIIIPIIILSTILLIIFLRPKKEKEEQDEIKQITEIKHFSFDYSQGYAINSYTRYKLDCDTICIVDIKPYGISEEENTVVEVDDTFVNNLIEIINKYKVIKWNGFNRVAKDVLDGDSFSFNLHAQDDISITASGYMMWPDNYREVCDEIDNLFNNLVNNKAS